jgi:hypothetical protein
MWRSLISAIIVYGSGHPGLDGYRPTIFDRPFQAFYLEVNHVAREGRVTLQSFENAAVLRDLKSFIWHRDG